MAFSEFVDLHVPTLALLAGCSCSMQAYADGRYDIVVDGPSIEVRRVIDMFRDRVAAELNGAGVWLRAEIHPEGLPAKRVLLRVSVEYG